MKALTIHRYESQGDLTFADNVVIWAMLTSPLWLSALGLVID